MAAPRSENDENATPPPSPHAIDRGHWLVLVAAFLGWMFDGFEMGLFPLIARPALTDLLHDPGDAVVAAWMGRITATFLVGAALGGGLFGWLGDRIGRVRAMALSILVYSLCTGLGYWAGTPLALAGSRFLAALGMGGEWALGVALVMECWPARWRVLLAGVIGAAANVGFLLIALVGVCVHVTRDDWRFVLLVGTAPAVLTLFVRLFVPESPRWRAVAGEGPHQPLREVFAPDLRRRTLLAIGMAAVALVGTWGCVEWLPLWADQMAGVEHPGAKALTGVVRSGGAVLGCLLAPFLGARFGRRPAFAVLCVLSLALCTVLYRTVDAFGAPFLVLVFLVGAAATSFYGWFPLYLPELFPTRVRATGQGLAYNAGRLLAAVGALGTAELVGFFGSYPAASAAIAFVYLGGLLLLVWAPETRGAELRDR